MKEKHGKRSASLLQKELSWWLSPVTAADLAKILLALWASIAVMDFASDHISDAYHIKQIDNLIHKALDIKQDSSISDEEKKEKVNILISDALHHNDKITRSTKSHKDAILNLDAENSRSSRF